MNIENQTEQILKALKQGERITPLEALHRFECFRLGARIWDLKQLGHNIDKNLVKTPKGKRVAEYFMKISA